MDIIDSLLNNKTIILLKSCEISFDFSQLYFEEQFLNITNGISKYVS